MRDKQQHLRQKVKKEVAFCERLKDLAREKWKNQESIRQLRTNFPEMWNGGKVNRKLRNCDSECR